MHCVADRVLSCFFVRQLLCSICWLIFLLWPCHIQLKYFCDFNIRLYTSRKTMCDHRPTHTPTLSRVLDNRQVSTLLTQAAAHACALLRSRGRHDSPACAQGQQLKPSSSCARTKKQKAKKQTKKLTKPNKQAYQNAKPNKQIQRLLLLLLSMALWLRPDPWQTKLAAFCGVNVLTSKPRIWRAKKRSHSSCEV